MAPHFWGQHYLIECEDCNFPVRFQLVEGQAIPEKITCPNCGYRDLPFTAAARMPADRVAIDQNQPPERWSVVALMLPDRPGYGIKRVLGLPQETISFHQGNLYVDDQLVRKSWEQLCQQRILVFDSNYWPQTSEASRWQILNPETSQWQSTRGRLKRQSTIDVPIKPAEAIPINRLAPGNDWDWIAYCHWRGCRHAGQRHDCLPIEDVDYFNPQIARQLNPTTEIVLQIDFEKIDGDFGWRFHRGTESFFFAINTDQHYLKVDSESLDSESLDSGSLDSGSLDFNRSETLPLKSLEFSSCDDQLQVRINGKLIYSANLNPLKGMIDTKLIELGHRGKNCQIDRVRIWRDLYWNEEPSQSIRPLQASSNQYLLMGDNLPLSVDSRSWETPGVPIDKIIGVVNADPEN